MKFLFFLIFVLASGGGTLFLLYKYDKNLANIQRDNHLLRNQLTSLKEKYNNLIESKKNYSIEFLTVDNHYALLPKDSPIYLLPNENSYILQKLSMNMQVAILEKALIDNSTWYYVALPLNTNINSRGWSPEKNFSDISDTPLEINTK